MPLQVKGVVKALATESAQIALDVAVTFHVTIE